MLSVVLGPDDRSSISNRDRVRTPGASDRGTIRKIPTPFECKLDDSLDLPSLVRVDRVEVPTAPEKTAY
jgi:hypothetical protein